jgi:hypothetical protein
MRYSRQSGKWADQAAWLTALRETTLFGGTVEASHARALRVPAETVLGVERTRAAFLSDSKQDQADFTADLRALFGHSSQVDLSRKSSSPWRGRPAHVSALRSGTPGHRRTRPAPQGQNRTSAAVASGRTPMSAAARPIGRSGV